MPAKISIADRRRRAAAARTASIDDTPSLGELIPTRLRGGLHWVDLRGAAATASAIGSAVGLGDVDLRGAVAREADRSARSAQQIR